jgi:hypothetical protein
VLSRNSMSLHLDKYLSCKLPLLVMADMTQPLCFLISFCVLIISQARVYLADI